jgi:hypothetical protein
LDLDVVVSIASVIDSSFEAGDVAAAHGSAPRSDPCLRRAARGRRRETGNATAV